MKITAQQIESFQSSGFVIIPQLYSDDEIARLRELVYKIYAKLVPEDCELKNTADPWGSELFDTKLQQLRNRFPDRFGELFDTVQGSYLFHQFATKSEVSSTVAALLGEPPENLSCSGFLYRMDPPQDTKNTLKWHQDISYFPQNFHGENGLVVSTVLQDTPAEMGALHVCVGSQNESAVMPEYGVNEKVGVSEQRELPPSIVARHSVAICEMQKGDTLIFNLNLFHSSGFNRSNRIRFSTLCRYHKMVDDDYVPFRVYHKFNSAAIERVLNNRGELGQVFRTFYEKG